MIIILIHPQLGENIGMCARAMLNCGITDLRLVAPRDGWPSETAEKASAGAHIVLQQATVYATAEEAIADCAVVYATTARHRAMAKPVLMLEEAAKQLQQHEGFTPPRKTAVLFGAVRSGLDNDTIALADYVLSIPTNPDFSSFNLAQAVLLVCHAVHTLSPIGVTTEDIAPPASKAALEHFFTRLENTLDAKGFLQPAEKRPLMVRNIRTLFTRAHPSAQELQTLEGILTALTR